MDHGAYMFWDLLEKEKEKGNPCLFHNHNGSPQRENQKQPNAMQGPEVEQSALHLDLFQHDYTASFCLNAP